jgi:hypothetical protein
MSTTEAPPASVDVMPASPFNVWLALHGAATDTTSPDGGQS